MNFQRISDIVPKVLAKKNMANISKKEQCKHVFMEILEEVFGNEFAGKVTVADFQNKVITLNTKDNITAQKIQLSSAILLEKMEKMGFANVERIYSRSENINS